MVISCTTFAGYNTESREISLDMRALVHFIGYNTESLAILDTQALVHFSGFNTGFGAL